MSANIEAVEADLKQYLSEQQQVVDRVLAEWVPKESVEPHSIHKAMRYSLFAGGKRIRPVLAISAARAVSDSPEGVENAAATLELIHTYSLIHDDLPALDNDDLRRGRPTCHKVFGEAMAILAGDALLTLAFEVLSTLPSVTAERQIRLVKELSRASGTVGGMIGGQVNDIEGERRTPTAHSVGIDPRAKTGALIRASVRMGAIYAGATDERAGRAHRVWRAYRPGFSDRRRRAGCGAVSEKSGQDGGQGQAQQKITFRPSTVWSGRVKWRKKSG